MSETSPSVPEGCVFPLSFAQQRLWFLDRIAPGNPFYNIPLAIPIQTLIDARALERALNAVVARHEALRTTFQIVDGEPSQVVHEAMAIPVSVIDLSQEDAAQRDRRTVELAIDEARRPFDLQTGPLLRCGLVTRGAFDHVLLLSLHHIVADGWSMGILASELTVLYQGFILGWHVPLPELPIQYVDFTVWQRQHLQGETLERQLEYWREQLRDLPVLELPYDRPRPAALTYRGAFRQIALTQGLSEGVRRLAQAHGATPFMVLTAGFAILLQRYTGQDDIVIGTPVANRNRAEIEGLIGFFVNSLVLRIDSSGDPTFTGLIARVREVCLQAYAHQDLPFEKLVEHLQPQRDPSRNPLFQVTLQLVNTPGLPASNAATGHSVLQVQRGTAIFDLALTLLDSSAGFGGMIEYSTDLFDDATIERFQARLQLILEWAVANPTGCISDITLLDAAERAEELRAARGPERLITKDGFVTSVIARQAAAFPNAIVVRSHTGNLTYRELLLAADSIALKLAVLGTGPPTRVALLMNRSTDMIAAMLAILQIGATYVPLDPTQPADRLRFMIADSEVSAVCTDSSHVKLAESVVPANAAVVRADASGMGISLVPQATGVWRSPCAEDLAYVMYTSGSTGSPKGVAISHGALANHMAWMMERFPLSCSDRVLQRTLSTFDASVWEIFAPLMSVAQLVLLPPDAQKDPEAIVRHIDEHQISVVQFVPSLLREVLDDPCFFTCSSLRRIFCGGEALSEEIRARVHASVAVELVNLYGPTEATIDATFYACGADSEPFGVPVGEPIANMRAYVLDEHLQLVPRGVSGELYLAGMGLARGYIGQPQLTADRFLPDPFGSAGSRMYRTGDLVRRMSNGRLVYLGRMDQQVKIRGHRIELGEIEAGIDRVPGVRRSAVVARLDPVRGVSLAAFAIPSIDETEMGISSPAGRQGVNLADHVSNWQTVYEQVYADLPTSRSESENFVGWNSSYNGAPMPLEDMHEWLDCTTRRIIELKPTRILEIGCGTGLLLRRLAPHCEHYTGIDFSPPALQYLRSNMASLPGRGGNVELILGRADELTALAPGWYDTVILNSVVQYFPDIEYLSRVLRLAMRALSPRGVIFIGDVRSLPLQRTFQLTKTLARSVTAPGTDAMSNGIYASVDEERELLIDPSFFYSVATELAALGGAQVLLKRGRRSNELTRFRYDVVIRRSATQSCEPCRALDWFRDGCTLETLASLLSNSAEDRFIIQSVPNGHLREGVHPEDVWEMSSDVRLTFSRYPHIDCFDVVLCRPGAAPIADPAAAEVGTASKDIAPRARANNPLRATLARALTLRIREVLQSSLPDYMVPASITLVDELPSLPSGKLNRRALEMRSLADHEQDDYESPRTDLEEALAMLWAEVLGMERVGIREDFFTHLGGHSLLATRLIARVREGLEIDTPLKQIFQSPTVEQFAAALLESAPDTQSLLANASLLVKVGGLSEDELNAALQKPSRVFG